MVHLDHPSAKEKVKVEVITNTHRKWTCLLSMKWSQLQNDQSTLLTTMKPIEIWSITIMDKTIKMMNL